MKLLLKFTALLILAGLIGILTGQVLLRLKERQYTECLQFYKQSQPVKCGSYDISNTIDNEYTVYSLVGKIKKINKDDNGNYSAVFETRTIKNRWTTVDVYLGNKNSNSQVFIQEIPNGDWGSVRGESKTIKLSDVDSFFSTSREVIMTFPVYIDLAVSEKKITDLSKKQLFTNLKTYLKNNSEFFALSKSLPSGYWLLSTGIIVTPRK